MFLLAFWGHVVFAFLYSNLNIERNVEALGFWATTFCSPFLLYMLAHRLITNRTQVKEIFQFLQALIWVQVPLIVVQTFRGLHFEVGDRAKGSFGSAHIVGFYLLLLLSIVIIDTFTTRKPARNHSLKGLLLVCGLLTCVVVTDAKAILLAYFCAGLLLAVAVGTRRALFALSSWVISRKTLVLIAALPILVSAVLTFPLLANAYYHAFGTGGSFDRSLVRNVDPSNPGSHKAAFYYRILVELPKRYNAMIGTGPGTLGSRAANSRAYDTLAKKKGRRVPAFIPAFTSTPAKQFLVDLYLSEFALRSGSRSALLTQPFAGVATIIAELGYVGFALYLAVVLGFIVLLIQRKDHHESSAAVATSVAILAFLFYSILENAQERPQLGGVLFLLAGLLLAATREYPTGPLLKENK